MPFQSGLNLFVSYSLLKKFQSY